jgi:regulator of RNase E activity RraA
MESFDSLVLPAPPIAQTLPIMGPSPQRPDRDHIERLHTVSTATAAALMHRMGVRQTFIQGPLPRTPGAKVVGPVVTLQFMPRREDVITGIMPAAGEEQLEKATALWSVFETVEEGDVLAVQAFGDLYSGCMGDMLVTFFKGRGGAGIVVDGCVRDWPRLQTIGTPLWTCGFTPNYASQATLLPWAVNVPVALSRVLVLPGDVMIADDDGAVIVPANMVPLVLKHTLDHEEWEEFSRMRLSEGGSIRKYYPLSEEGEAEYAEWKKARDTRDKS